jgi:hypothetical protein
LRYEIHWMEDRDWYNLQPKGFSSGCKDNQ